MPCFDTEKAERDEHNSVAAELLCALLRRIENGEAPWTPELLDWWKAHQARDKRLGL